MAEKSPNKDIHTSDKKDHEKSSAKSGRKSAKKVQAESPEKLEQKQEEGRPRRRAARSKEDGDHDHEEQPQQKQAKGRGRGKKGAEQADQEEPKLSKKFQKLQSTHDIQQLQDIAHQLRIYSTEMVEYSKSGHPTSCASIAEIMAVLFFDPSGMRYSPTNHRNFHNDRFVLSKGHAAPILYAAYSVAGVVDTNEFKNFRKLASEYEGHPTPRLGFVDVATGSLGQGLSVAGGMAYSSKYLDKIDNRYYVILGDGECAEGSVWEACNLAAHYKLSNLTVFVDVNRLGQSEETMHQHDIEAYRRKFESFGFATFKIDGHNIYEIIETLEKCKNIKDQPQAIIAKTFKGKYMEGIENFLDWHGKPLGQEKSGPVIQQLKSLQKTQNFTLRPTHPPADVPYPEFSHFQLDQLTYSKGTKIAPRKAYGTGLVHLHKSDVHKQIVSLDGDTKNSTFSLTYKQAVPENFIECYIAEQNMVGWAQGLACRNKVAFCATFGAFFTRAGDQIRMGGISRSQIKCVGSHCGVSIGEDGPSQMALEDLGLFRAVPNSIVLYPSDAVSAERAVELAANYRGLAYIRTSRPELPVLYDNNDKFDLGRSRVLVESEQDQLVVIGAGVTVHEALAAQQRLEKENIRISLIDLFSVKPFDRDTILQRVRKTQKKIILTVEEHYLQGGIFETVTSGLADQTDIRVFAIGVIDLPRSGTPAELLAHYHLDANGIYNRIKELLS